MDTNNTLDRMATYDFKAPIDIVCFEENSDDEIDLTSSPKSSSKDTDTEKGANEKVLKGTEGNEKNVGKDLQIIEDENNVKAKKRKCDSKRTDSEKKDNENNRTTIIVSPKKQKLSDSLNTTKASDSLNTVSKYLTLILESLQYYLIAAKNKNSTPSQISLSKKSYLTVKYHFFKAAYEHVNSHILPNENNQAFIHNFLNHTIDMANNRMKFDCNQGITEIYFEMTKWVKQRKLKAFSDSCKTPILMKHLRDPPVIPDVTITESVTNVPQQCPNEVNQNNLCIFSSGPPGRQININVEKSLINYNNEVPGSDRLPPNKVIQQNHNTQQNLHKRLSPNNNISLGSVNNVENNYGKQNNFIQPEVPANGYLPIDNRLTPYVRPPNCSRNVVNDINQISSNTHYSYYHTTNDNRVTRYVSPPKCSRNLVNDINQISSNNNYNYYHTTNNFQSHNFYSANNIMHDGISQVPNTIVHGDRSLRTFRKDYPHRPDVRAPPPPYQAPAAVYQNQTIPATLPPCGLPGLPSGTDLTRSSVSTDSGFVSPVGSKSSTNPIEDIMNDLFELENTIEQTRATPSQAVCHVCHKHAKLMCSACFKTAYCNAKCQRVDWEAHRLFCPPLTGKRNQ